MSTQDEGPSAVLGNRAGGTSSAGSAAVNFAAERAMKMAKDSGQETPTLEQLLFVLLDDKYVQQMFANQRIDSDTIRSSLRAHLQSASESQAPPNPHLSSTLRNVMRRALVRNMVANRREVETTDVVVAILAEGNSYAAQVLSEQGLAVDEAANEALSLFLAKQAEQLRRLEETRARIAEQNARQARPDTPVLLASAVVSDGTTARGPHAYTLRVASGAGEAELRFKLAVSHDGRLDLYIESTPFETEFVASRVAALFEVIDGDRHLKVNVELSTEIDGQRRTVSGVGGRAGAIFDDRIREQRSGTL